MDVITYFDMYSDLNMQEVFCPSLLINKHIAGTDEIVSMINCITLTTTKPNSSLIY